MNIGTASERSRVSAKMIRYYESVGLLAPAARRDNGYRDYSETDVAILQFVRRSLDLGFSLDETRNLLALWRAKKPSRDVKRLAEMHIAHLEQRIREMRSMADTLLELARSCHGDDRPDCPILRDLTEPRQASAEPKQMRKRGPGLRRRIDNR